MAERQTQVLFLDDDPEFLGVVQELAVQHTQGAWNPRVSHDPAGALAELKAHPVDLLVIDIHLPQVDGLQFLRLIGRKYPNLLKVVLTGDSTGAYREQCLDSGAELFLEKPRDVGGWQSIFATLLQIAQFRPEDGFTGILRRVGLQDVIQMECLSRNSTLLEITTAGQQGRIFIREGRIVHAVAGERTGEAAFNHILRLTGGEFNLKPFAEPEVETISGSWESLLMDAAQQRDEALENPAEAPATESDTAILAELSNAELPPSPIQQADAHGGPDNPASGLPHRPRTDEFLVCSTQGDVLHEWQCADSNVRIRFLETLSQKARLIAQGLPLGGLERVEAAEGRARALVQVEADRVLFLRASSVPVEAAR